jgi:hypothetical protein
MATIAPCFAGVCGEVDYGFPQPMDYADRLDWLNRNGQPTVRDGDWPVPMEMVPLELLRMP